MELEELLESLPDLTRQNPPRLIPSRTLIPRTRTGLARLKNGYVPPTLLFALRSPLSLLSTWTLTLKPPPL